MEMGEQHNNIISPALYCKGGIECLDAIEASMTSDAFRGFCKGCILKYLWRYEQKGWIESLEKARFYIDRLIRHLNENES